MNFPQSFRASRAITISPSFRLVSRLILYTAIPFALCGSIAIVKSGRTAAFILAGTSFNGPATYPVGSHPYSVAGFQDIVGEPVLAVTNNADDTVSVLFGQSFPRTGNFTVTKTVNLPTGSKPQAVVYATIGQFKKSSLVIASSWPSQAKGKVTVIPVGYSGEPSFGAVTEYLVGSFPESVATGDFNGDGIEDIVAANYGESTISLLIGNADETFQPAITLPNAISQNPEFIIAKDFDLDGKADLATCNTGSAVQGNKVNVLLGNGNGTFKVPAVYSVGSTPTGATPYFLTAADFNNDGRPDIATSNHNTDEVSVLLNGAAGGFSLVGNIPLGATANPYAIVAGDFNLDNYVDLAVASSGDHKLRILLNNQDATFQLPVLVDVGTNPFGVTTGDFNFDRRSDIAVANNGSNSVSVFLNTAAPENDLFVNAKPISGASGIELGTNAGATREVGEPSPPQGPSVWYKWEAPTNGTATFAAVGVDFPNIRFTVFEGSTLDNLTTIGSSTDESTVWFTATAGTVYRIVVAGDFTDDLNGIGSFNLTWSLIDPPANDFFINAETISTPSGTMNVSNVGAAREVGEPAHAGQPLGRSIWYKWQAPSNGSMTFTTTASDLDYTIVAVYTGTTVSMLNVVPRIGFNINTITFGTTAGTFYQIALDSGNPGRSGNMTLTWQFGPPPGNDDLLTAQTLVGIPGKIDANNFGASNQQNENPHDGVQGGTSVWYQWTALDDQRVTFSTWGSSIDTLLAVYEGSVFPLTKIVSNNDDGGEQCTPRSSRVSFKPQSGKTYKIAVDGVAGVSGPLVLRWGHSRSITATLFSAFLFGDACRDFGGGTISDLPSGAHYAVSTSASNFVSFASGNLSLVNGDVTVYFFHTIPTFGIRGTITTPGGNPPSVTIKATINAGPPGLVPATFAGYNAATGEYSFGSNYWSDYSYTVTASAPNYKFTPTSDAEHVSGAGGSFTTVNFVASQFPTTTTSTQTSVTSNGATINGTVNPNGSATVGWFEWGTDSTLLSSTSTTQQSLGSGVSNQPLTTTLSGLSANTNYYFRAVGMNNAGTAKGDILGFTTTGPTPTPTPSPTPTPTPSPTPTPTPTPSPTPTPTPTPSPTPTATPTPNTIQFSASTFSASEGATSVNVTVTRSGDSSGTASIDYITTDTDNFTVNCGNVAGNAFARCDFATSVDTLTFAPGETSKTFAIPIINDSIAEGSETFGVTLSNVTGGATLGSPFTTTITITDNESVTGPNPIFTTPFFVRQHYLDFLSREPEAGEPWSGVLNNCSDVNNNPACDRLTVSGAFFGSEEFSLKGLFAYRFYKLAFTRLPLILFCGRNRRRPDGRREAPSPIRLP